MKKICCGFIILLGVFMLIPSIVMGAETPVIKGNSVYRDTTSTAKIVFNSSLAGTGYYIITNSATQPEFSDMISTENDTLSVIAGINEIDITGMSTGAKYAHIIVMQGEDKSNILTIAMPYDVYYFDDFEAYTENTYPSFFTLKYNGNSTLDQKVINTNENKVFNAYGTYARGLDERIQINSLSTGYAVLEADLIVPDELPDSYYFGGIALGHDFDDDTRNIVVQVKNNSNIFMSVGHNSSISCEANTTYRVRIVVDVASKKMDYYIKNEKANDEPLQVNSLTQLEWFGIYNGSGTVHYDNIKFYVQDLNPSAHEISKGSETNGTFMVNKEYEVQGEAITVTPTANEGYRVKSVKVNGSEEGVTNNTINYTFTMPDEDVEVTVVFELMPYEISKAPTTNGSFLVKIGSTEVNSAVAGDIITVIPTADDNYRVKNVNVVDYNDSETIFPYDSETKTFTMPNKKVVVSVEFELVKKITIRDIMNGRVTSDKDVAIPGEMVTLTVSPNSDYRLSDIRILDMYDDEPVSLNNNYTFTMPEYNVFIYAEFSIIPTSSGSSTPRYQITVVQNENGEISFDGSTKVKRNKDKEFIITPNEGYEIEDVLVDGESVGKVSTYIFENIKKAHTIEAKYKEIEIPDISYIDVFENDWFSDAVEYVTEKGLMSGIESNKFNPRGNTTRAMIITILYNLEDEPKVEYEASFKDVEKGESYEKPIAWAEKNRIVKGINDETFAPDKEVTREELAMIMLNYINYKNIEKPKDVSKLNFADNDEISLWAKDAVKLMKKMKIMEGRNNNLFAPSGLATRAEIATIIMNFCESIK